jgi:hypothetical protein
VSIHRPIAILTLELLLFAVLGSIAMNVAAGGPVRASELSPLLNLAVDFLVGFGYFALAILSAGTVSAVATILARRLPPGIRATIVIGSPAVVFPAAIAALLVLEARRGIPLINHGNPYLYAGAVAGLAVGVSMAILLRGEEKNRPEEARVKRWGRS